MMRKLLILGVVAGAALMVAPTALAQQTYPPPPDCTNEERAAFKRQQKADTDAFKDAQQEQRRLFRESGPHSPAEKRAFNRSQQEQLRAFRNQRHQAKKAFLANCKAGVRPRVGSGPAAFSTEATRPAITVGHLFLVAAAAMGFVLIRRTVRARSRR